MPRRAPYAIALGRAGRVAAVAGTTAAIALPAGVAVSGSAAAAADDTPPRIEASLVGLRGTPGWFRGDVTVSWTVTDPESLVTDEAGCNTQTVRSDTAGLRVTCWARNAAGLENESTVTIRRDTVAPTVAGASPERAADRNGWFNAPVLFEFAGTDATSGIAACAEVRYAGPDVENGRVGGSCTDRAGNVRKGSIRIDYDATRPKVRGKLGRKPDRYGWYGRAVAIRWSGKDAVSGVAHCSRGRIYRGPNSGQASRTGSCVDEAGNRRRRTVTFRFSRPLLSPKAGARLSGRPVLKWIEVRRARYYNVQLWRGSKVLSRWPNAERKKLPRTWMFRGERQRLEPGRYTWYVWPRFDDGYGRMIGKSSFVIRRG